MRIKNLSSTIICMTLTVLGGTRAFADDTEVFFGASASSGGIQPNVLLVLDTSGSMDSTVTSRIAYSPSGTYSGGGCSSGYVYYQSASSGSTPDCSSSQKILASSFYCTPATTAFTTAGKYIGNAIGWKSSTSGGWGWWGGGSTTYSWSASFTSGGWGGGGSAPTYITCELDTDSSYPLASSSSSSSAQWSGTSTNNYYTTSNNPTFTSYVFYSAHYVEYLNDSSQITSSSTRMEVAKQAAKDLIDASSGINVGLMRYDEDAQGGMVVAEMQDVTAGADDLKDAIDDMTADGFTPLSETLYEAYLYYSGATMQYGNSSDPTTSVVGSRVSAGSTTYKSPITSACQKNYVVFLTDGLPTQDTDADDEIEGLSTGSTGCYSGSSTMWSSLGYSSTPSGYSSGNGLCLKELSKQLGEKDLSSSLTGTQSATTYFIGFGDDVGGGAPQAFLEDAAAAGGGDAEVAGDADQLATAFEKTLGNVLDTNATFTSPSIAVNAFNKTQILEDMYVAMFKPSKTVHWNGNLKKFKLRNSLIVGQDSDTVSAVGANGFFTPAARDFWQQTGDAETDLTAKGGAAKRLPDPNSSTGSRQVYTYIGSNKPSGAQALSGHPFSTSNTNLTDAVMNVGSSTSSCGTSCQGLINWTRGDTDGDGNASEADLRRVMGDPVHSQPSVVIYGNTGSTDTAKLNDAVVYLATNDGFLHAIDVSTGVELWSYIPREVLSDLINVYDDAPTTTKHYSLDGDIRVLKYDVDNDGVVDTGSGQHDRVFLYFSQGRGGDNYYALDVTDKSNPQFMWSLDQSDLSTVERSWSTPTLGRVNTGSSSQNPQKLVLIFGGGYDNDEDSEAIQSSSGGNGIYMVDAVKGTVLWSKTYESTGAFSKMTHAIPSSVTLLDTNSDGWTDRLYVGDMAAQLWRFDITNYVDNSAPTSDISFAVAGGVIASLGAKAESTPTQADNRSFYNAPDVAKFVNTGAANYYNIAIGSGDRGLPKTNVTTNDYFYSIRDYHLGPMTQTTYDSYAAMTNASLTTVTGLAATTIGANGWKLAMTSTEKVLSQSVTVNGLVMFTSFIPGANSTACGDPSTGTGRAYTLYVAGGVKRFTDPDPGISTDGDGLYETFATTGLPSRINILNQSNIIRTDGTTGTTTATAAGTCISGVNILNGCVEFGTKVKTFWQESGAY